MSHGFRKALLVGLSLSLANPAAAQGVDEPAGDGGPIAGDDAQPADPIPPLAPTDRALAVDFRWEATGLSRATQGLAVTRAETVVAVDAQGGLHRMAKGGGWVRVLAAPLDDVDEVDSEDLLLEAEAAIGELAGSVEASADVDEDGAPQLDVDASAVLDSVELGAAATEESFEVEQGPTTWRVWSSTRVDGLVLASRPDGVWRSSDDGRTWLLIPDLPPMLDAIEPLGDAPIIVVGTAAGLRTSLDRGVSFVTVEDALSDLQVHALAADAQQLYAGTSAGLYASEDGVRWRALRTAGVEGQAIVEVAVDPNWEGGLWLATADAVLRSDDGGSSARQPALNALPGTLRLNVLREPGHLLSAGKDGVWESLDGGVRWAPLADGLSDPMVWDIVDGPFGAMLAGNRGVLRLARRPEREAASASTAPVGPPLGDVLGVALRRAGVAMEPLLASRTIARLGLMPRLRLGAQADHLQNLEADWSRGRTTLDRNFNWTFAGELCFGGCVDTYSAYDFDSSYEYDPDYAEDLDYEDVADSDVFVMEGEVYSYEESGSFGPAAANVVERIARRRTDVSTTVAELYLARRQLIASQASSAALPLREQVSLAVEIAELTARLDVYTDGYFTSALNGS